MNQYTVCFRKRIKGKKAEAITAAGHRRTRERVEFVDESGAIIKSYPVSWVREIIPISDDSDPLLAVSDVE
jgi:hypothetical protein